MCVYWYLFLLLLYTYIRTQARARSRSNQFNRENTDQALVTFSRWCATEHRSQSPRGISI